MEVEPEAYDAFVRERTAEYDAQMRSRGHLVSSTAIVAATAFATLLPGAREVVDLSFAQAASILSSLILVVVLATAAYHRFGPASTAYRVLDDVETISVQLSLAALIVLSGTAISPLWVFYLGHVFLLAAHPRPSWAARIAVGAAPALVALVFFVQEGPGASVFSAIAAATMGGLTVGFASVFRSRLSRLSFERESLQRRVAELEVESERRRIARDLHDGLTADLTAIAWRAEVLARSDGGEDPKQELAAIARRARAAIDDTRSVVWALRGEDVPWARLVDHIRSRCEDLCGSRVELALEAASADHVVGGQLAVDIVRMVQEAVRNALRHGAPSAVTVGMALDDAITLTVDDDGVGLDPEGSPRGGLRNLRLRAEAHGGAVEFSRRDPGTRVQVALPLSR